MGTANASTASLISPKTKEFVGDRVLESRADGWLGLLLPAGRRRLAVEPFQASVFSIVKWEQSLARRIKKNIQKSLTASYLLYSNEDFKDSLQGGGWLWVAPHSAAGTLVLTGATRRRAAAHTSSAEVSVSILRRCLEKRSTFSFQLGATQE